jgi:adenylate cyclase
MLVIAVSNEKQNLRLEHAGTIEFGRGPQRSGVTRCTVDDAWVSRDHLQVEELPADRVRLQNLSRRTPVELSDGGVMNIGETREFPLPVRLTIGETIVSLTTLAIAARPGARSEAGAIPAVSQMPTLAPSVAPALGNMAVTQALVQPDLPELTNDEFAAEGFRAIEPVKPSSRSVPAAHPVALGDAPSPEVLMNWMETILALQRSSGEAQEFFDQAARALVNMIGLDVGLVILYPSKNWKVVARAARREEGDPRRFGGREFSQTVLRQVLTEKQTFFQDLRLMRSQESLQSVDAVVGSPIFGSDEEVTGVLYGLRRSQGRGKGAKITPLEAQLVQLLAAAVGANLARGEATRTRTQFEQFFSPNLVRHLATDPGLLAGRETTVTVLFADVREFSAYSEKQGAAVSIRWMNDVLNELSLCVREEEGVLVDYVGDELMAMWGAPEPQPDQARRAVRAALAMHAVLPTLDRRWQATLGAPVRIGVGVNSGTAQVGNVGSTIKFKYGAIGNTVNLASRVQGLTKHLRCGLLVAAATAQQLGDGFATRRIVKARVVNIETPVDLYEVEPTGTPERQAFFAASQASLDALEAGRFAEAARAAGTLLTAYSNDGPLLLTLARAAEAAMRGGEGFAPVWTPPSK